MPFGNIQWLKILQESNSMETSLSGTSKKREELTFKLPTTRLHTWDLEYRNWTPYTTEMFHACWKGNSCGFLTCSSNADSVESPVKLGKQGTKCFLIHTHTPKNFSFIDSQYCFVPSATKTSLIHPFRHCCMNLFQLYFFFFFLFLHKEMKESEMWWNVVVYTEEWG